MNPTSLAILYAISIMLTTGTANANLLFDIYMGGTYGIGGQTIFTDGDDISKSSTSYGAVLGTDIPLFRIELEYNYLDSAKITSNFGMVNAYFKIPTPILKPYIGAGIGMSFDAKYTPRGTTHIEIDDTMAYQGMLGVTLNLPALPFNIDVEGRALYAPNMFKIADNDVKFLQYDGRVKLRYIF